MCVASSGSKCGEACFGALRTISEAGVTTRASDVFFYLRTDLADRDIAFRAFFESLSRAIAARAKMSRVVLRSRNDSARGRDTTRAVGSDITSGCSGACQADNLQRITRREGRPRRGIRRSMMAKS